jgi:hypothetical protein
LTGIRKGALLLIAVLATAGIGAAQGRREGQERKAQPQARQPMRPGRHMGDWLRKHQDQPPQEQEHALQNDPAFQRLPQERQERLMQRLRNFNSMPPEQRQRVLDRMETFERLPPEQQQHIRQLFGQMRDLPDDRRQAVRQAAHRLRQMPPDERERTLNSPAFRNRFSDQERELVRGLATVDGGHEEGPGSPDERR